MPAGSNPVWSEFKSPGPAVAVSEEAGQRGDGDLGRDAGADVEPDRPVHAGDLLRRDAEFGEHGHVRPDVMRVAHDPDPPRLGGQPVAEHDAALAPLMVAA